MPWLRLPRLGSDEAGGLQATQVEMPEVDKEKQGSPEM